MAHFFTTIVIPCTGCMCHRCEALAAVGRSVANSEAQLRACEFLLGRQCADGGWGESYLSCQDKARTWASAHWNATFVGIVS